MDILGDIIAFLIGAAAVWIFKGTLQADIAALHTKIDGIIAAIKAKV